MRHKKGNSTVIFMTFMSRASTNNICIYAFDATHFWHGIDTKSCA